MDETPNIDRVLKFVNGLIKEVNQQVKSKVGELEIKYKEGRLVKDTKELTAKKLREIAEALEEKPQK
ncbi:MAG: hypothetical protein GOU97_04560 [Nanoarchaeota archaeon]|nr:hypothetical protein [Nanoarchaeota archaeon]